MLPPLKARVTTCRGIATVSVLMSITGCSFVEEAFCDVAGKEPSCMSRPTPSFYYDSGYYGYSSPYYEDESSDDDGGSGGSSQGSSDGSSTGGSSTGGSSTGGSSTGGSSTGGSSTGGSSTGGSSTGGSSTSGSSSGGSGGGTSASGEDGGGSDGSSTTGDSGGDGCPGRPTIPLGSDIGNGVAWASTTTDGWATDDHSSPCGGAGSRDVAFPWIAPSSGWFTVDTDGSDYRTIIMLMEDECGDYIQCDYGDPDYYPPSVELNATAGQMYTIVIDGYSGESGYYNLNINPR